MSAEAKLTIILEGMDTASGVMKAAADKIQGEMGKVTDANSRVEAAQKKTEISTKSLVLGFSGIATAAFNLFNMYDRVNDTQVQMDRTNLMVKRSTEALDQATKNYNETVAKYGEGSAEAKDASDKLSIATDALTVANERAEMAATSHNQALTNMAIQIMPTAITMIGSLSMVMTNATAITKGFNTALEFINANPIVLVLVGITAALIYLYSNCEGVRNAINAIGSAFVAFGNAVLNFCGWIISGWNTLVGSVAKGADAASERFKAMDDTMYNIALHGQRAFQAVTSAIVDVTESAKKLASAFGDITQSSSDTTDQIDFLRKGLDDYNKQVNANIEAMKKQEENWSGSRAGLQALRTDIQNATSDQVAFNDVALKEISRLEDVAKAQKVYEDALTGLSEKYNVLTATADASFSRVAKAFNDAFLSGDITSAINLADIFAARWGIDINKVISMFESVPTTIEDQLVGKAQANLETFKNCVSGKMAKIGDDSAGAWETLVSETNDLIKNGLVGQAQDNIKAFVECSTSKQQKMTEDIAGYLDQLQGTYDSNVTKINALVAAGKLDEAKIWENANEGIKAKMDQLQTWLDAIMAQMASTSQDWWRKILSPTAESMAAATATFGQFGGATGEELIKMARNYYGPATPTTPAAGEGATEPTPPTEATPPEATPPAGATGGTRAGKATPYAEGGIAWGPTHALIGEREPEAVVNVRDLMRQRGTSPVFNGPYVVVQGSMDKAVADYVVQKVKEVLKSVVVEATSSGAPATQKRIRTGATFR